MSQPEMAPKGEPILFVAPETPLDFKETYTEELVIGLCGPIGSPIHPVAEKLKSLLVNNYKYDCVIIKMSHIIQERTENCGDLPEFDRIKKLIQLGNNLRKKYGPSILAELAINQISLARNKEKEVNKRPNFKSRRFCYIIDSIKNQSELNVFRSVYRELFYFIGVFSPLEIRKENLKERGDRGIPLPKVFDLIDQDSGEELDYGQTVRDTFPQSDFFLRLDSSSDNQVEPKLIRVLHLIFGTNIVTPSYAETAMYFAASAAGNSACLSRQVGACLTDSQGNFLSVGWNDVPKFGGGLYAHPPSNGEQVNTKDDRCAFKDGVCYNDQEKSSIIRLITDELIKKGVINTKDRDKAASVIYTSKIKDLIEFSRSIHAEMHAIISACKAYGDRVFGGKLFCTTYPCHSCARHIITSGIKEVYYIDPYRKSLAIKLHKDSITENEEASEKVKIRMFDGIAPRRYLEFFKNSDDGRKENGKKVEVNSKDSSPRAMISLESIPALEGVIVHNLVAKKLITGV